MATMLQLLGEDPRRAQDAIGEPRVLSEFAHVLERGRELAGNRELPPHIDLMAAGAVTGLISDQVMAGRAKLLPEMLPDLLFAALVPYIGPGPAADEMRSAARAGPPSAG